MNSGDGICLYDDMSDDAHRLSAVLGLTRGWEPGDGGETIVGEVESVQDLTTPPEIPFQLQRWTRKDDYATLPPSFNAFTVIRLSNKLAHGVNPLIAYKVRFSLVALYGWDESGREVDEV
jgi:Rps23 Pro-64 3,4-dihydroxylase Tpa1-like proline 4-hydroxylase